PRYTYDSLLLVAYSTFYVTLLFLFQGDSHHRYLHSFPTRRSSDLYITTGGTGKLRGIKGLGRYTGLLELTAEGKATRNEVSAERSEEHTSELQSRFDLVCRLLLEKKKNV